MTQRERVLAGVLFGMLVLVGGGVAGFLFVYRPLTAVNNQLRVAQDQLKKKQAELAAEEQQIEGLLRINPRLSQWTKLSLPPRDPTAKRVPLALQEEQKKKHLNNLQVEYEAYLSRLLTASGLKSPKVDPRPIERRTGQAFKGAQPSYERLGFGAQATGTMANVTKALREFHKTPLLQQVRNLSLTNASSGGRATSDGTLDLKFVVEVLMVTGGEERVGLLPSKLAYAPRVLAEPGRDYDVLNKRNLFTGFTVRRDEGPRVDEKPSGPKEKKEDVLRFVKLTMLAYNPKRDRWEATLYDQAKGGAETNLARGVVRGSFTINDRYKNPVLEGKVILIDETQMIFLADKKYYRMHCGDFFLSAMKASLKNRDLEALGIEPEEEEKKEDKAEEEGGEE